MVWRALPVIVAAVVAGACAGPFTATNGKLTVPDHGFEVNLPQGWYRVTSLLPVKILRPGDSPSVSDGDVVYYRVNPQGEYAIEPPLPEDSPLLLSRDGFALQIIGVGRRPRDKALPYRGKVLSQEMSPQAVSEAVADDLRAAAGLLDLAIVESGTATVGGRAGYQVVYTWTTHGGLRMAQRRYGVLDGPWMYQLVYQAAARYYFDRDLPTFEQVVASFRLLTPSR